MGQVLSNKLGTILQNVINLLHHDWRIICNGELVPQQLSVHGGGPLHLLVTIGHGGGNSAVAVGDILYYVNADTPKISKKNTGVRYGYALQTVGSGSTATIRVLLGY